LRPIDQKRAGVSEPGFDLAMLGAGDLEIAAHEDGGKPKTGRRFYYLALSYADIKPDMGDTGRLKVREYQLWEVTALEPDSALQVR
jgi:hypothetical protein